MRYLTFSMALLGMVGLSGLTLLIAAIDLSVGISLAVLLLIAGGIGFALGRDDR
jgi:hypothetical protein